MSKGTAAEAKTPATALNPKVNGFLRVAKKWPAEMTALREICIGFHLVEDMKWRWPCYTLEGSNIVLIHAFKEYCALLFMKGSLMKDPKRLLAQPGELQAGRQLRFKSLEEIAKLKGTIKAYIEEAIAIELAGTKVVFKKPSEVPVPAEFRIQLDKQGALKKAFEALTPGRQKAYLYYFNQAKRPETRADRVEKCSKLILAGKGLDD